MADLRITEDEIHSLAMETLHGAVENVEESIRRALRIQRLRIVATVRERASRGAPAGMLAIVLGAMADEIEAAG